MDIARRIAGYLIVTMIIKPYDTEFGVGSSNPNLEIALPQFLPLPDPSASSLTDWFYCISRYDK